MKKIILLIMVVILSTGLSWGQQTLSLRDGTKTTGHSQTSPQREIVQQSNGITVCYTFNNAEIQEDPIFSDCVLWKMAGFGYNETPKEPSVLFRSDAFSIPNNCVASLEIVEAEYKDYDYNLAPARQPLPDNTYEGYNRNNISSIAPYNGFFPTKIVELSDLQIYRGNAIQNVQVSPIQYNYQNHIVRAYTKIKYKVSFIQNKIKTKSSVEDELPEISEDDFFLRNTILNYEEPLTDFTPTNGAKDYLIITTPKFLSAANKLAEWKKLLGLKPHIISKDSWTSTLVKSEVKSYYTSHKSLYYLLIIGDHDDVPAQTIQTGYRPHVTDFFYGCMDGDNDVIPDIYRGRISVSTLEEANIVVDKIINYESDPITSATFYQTGLNCAYFQDNNNDGYADRRFAQTSEEIRTYLTNIGKNIKRVYYTGSNITPRYWNNDLFSFGEPIPGELKKPGFAWNGNANDITAAINEGAFYVLHRDHGAETLWGDPRYTISNINGLSNGNKLPIVFSMNCLTGKINYSSPCFAETFLRKSEGGCVAIFAATETSMSGHNDALVCGMFDAIWPSPGLRPKFPGVSSTGGITPTPTYSLGQILDQGFIRMAETYGAVKTTWTQYTRELFHCFGDPSMKIYTAAPTSFSDVSINRSGKVSVSLSSGSARITFYDLNTGNVISQFGNSATYQTQTPNNVTVCISDHNKRPYISYGTAPTTVFIQNETITGPKTYTGSVIKIGSNVTDSKAQGPVKFDGGTITMSASEIQINPQTTISNTTTFKAIIK